METIKVPYGKGYLDFSIDRQRLKKVLLSSAHEYKSSQTEEDVVRQALDNPIDSPRLDELVWDKKNIVIIASDHTRPVPSHIITPLLLKEIRKANPDAKIKILVATGFHRLTSREELIDKFGINIVENEEIIVHDSEDDGSMLKLGVLPSGGELIINKAAAEADLLIAEGFIEPHFFAGFSGGRKSVLPGIASKTTVLANHCSKFIASECARTGILQGNPIHRDMIYAAQAAKLSFILNVVINAEKKIINAFAGHYNQAHLKGSEFVARMAGVEAALADIVIAGNGGYPLDQNIYQAVKGMTAAEANCKDGGVIIMLAECGDGHGGEGFYHTFKNEASVEKIMDSIVNTSQNDTIPDQWESQILARILLKHPVIMVSSEDTKKIVEDMHMRWAPSPEEAVHMADEVLDKRDAQITVIPDGVSVIVR